MKNGQPSYEMFEPVPLTSEIRLHVSRRRFKKVWARYLLRRKDLDGDDWRDMRRGQVSVARHSVWSGLRGCKPGRKYSLSAYEFGAAVHDQIIHRAMSDIEIESFNLDLARARDWSWPIIQAAKEAEFEKRVQQERQEEKRRERMTIIRRVGSKRFWQAQAMAGAV